MYSEFVDAVRAAIAEVWPETKANGIWDDSDIRFVEFIDVVRPMSVIEVPEMGRGEWGMDNSFAEGEIRIHYIMDAPGDLDVLRDKLNSLRTYLLTHDLDEGQVISVGSPDWSRSNEANLMFVHKAMPQIGGSLSVHCVVGDNVSYHPSP